jgi:hypothetical protein
MKKMLLVLSLAVVLPFATLAHASDVIGGSNTNVIGGSNTDVIGGSNTDVIGGSNTSASLLSLLWQSLVSVIGGSN